MQLHSKQPSSLDIQRLIQLMNAGQLPQAEAMAATMAKQFPSIPVIQNILGSARAGLGKYAEAIPCFQFLVGVDPNAPELQFNLALMCANAGQLALAETHYKRAIQLNPKFTDAHFNLGFLLQSQQRWSEAADSYQKALSLQPNFVEAMGNLGAVMQQQGRLDEAIAQYRQALSIRPDALGYFNLGTALRNAGQLEEAMVSFRRALEINPHYAEAYSNLGDALWHYGDLNAAVDCFNNALAIDSNNPSANYNLGVFLYDNRELERAITHFERAKVGDWRERVLYCLYKTKQFDRFESMLKELSGDVNTSPLLATLSTHYAINFGKEDQYNFCKAPLDFVYHGSIPELSEPNSPLLAALLRDIEQAEISQRKQSRLVNGIQSSGNLFKRPEASFRTLSELVARTIRDYYQHFAHHDCMFIRAFPKEIEFSSSWYVKMRSGGHLGSHIHEEGWISGAVYLAIPNRIASPEEGCIELSTHGDDYPLEHPNFPTRLVAPKVGDVCFFPSSVFHRTIPFSADEHRICIAFDLKPQIDSLNG